MKCSFNRKSIIIILLALVVLPLGLSAKKAKYVFFLIGDGMGINSAYTAEFYNKATGAGPQEINFLHFPVRTMMTTYAANTLVTDSAAAGTALATGEKTNSGWLGVDPDNEPMSSVAVWAKETGYGAGLITTVGVNHATPGAFYGHVNNRSAHDEITSKFPESKIDFLSGPCVYDTRNRPADSDFRPLDFLAKNGINVVCGKENFKDAVNVEGRLALFAFDNPSHDLISAADRTEEDVTLADLTQAGIDYLYKNYAKKGFFCMIEGGSIDHLAHSQDAYGTIIEINDFAQTVDVVLDFYNKHPKETLVIVGADHDTGALSIGSGSYDPNIAMLANQKFTEGYISDLFKKKFSETKPSWEEVRDFLKEYLGFWDGVEVKGWFENELRASYDKMIKEGSAGEVENWYSVNTRIIFDSVIYLNKKAGFSLPYSSHTGAPVGLFVKGVGAEEFMSCEDNTDVPKTIAKVAKYKR